MPHVKTITRRTMHNPAAFIGKRIDPLRWEIPAGYHLCRKTGKLHHEDDLLVTFDHTRFERSFLREHGILVEDAEWLSEEGYDEIMDVLERLGLRDYYINGGEFPGIAADYDSVEPQFVEVPCVKVHGHRLQVGDTVVCEGAKRPNGLPGEPTRRVVVAAEFVSLGEQRVTWKRMDDCSEMTGICQQIVSFTVYAGPSLAAVSEVADARISA